MESNTSTIQRLACGAGLVLLALGSLPAHAQQAEAKGIPGYLDMRTGQFTAVIPRAAAPEATTVTANGTIKMNFTITLKSSLPDTAGVDCSGTVSVSDYLASYSYTDTKTSKGTRTGTTATCSVSIPYSWVLPDRDQTISLNYVVGVTGLTDNSSTKNRTASSYSQPSLPLPANGATTTKNYNVTL